VKTPGSSLINDVCFLIYVLRVLCTFGLITIHTLVECSMRCSISKWVEDSIPSSSNSDIELIQCGALILLRLMNVLRRHIQYEFQFIKCVMF